MERIPETFGTKINKPLEKEINFTREAFMHPLNVGVLLVATLSAFFLSDAGYLPNVILSLAFGLELIYLGTVPRMPRFQRAIKIRKRKQRSQEIEDREVFSTLSPQFQRRFLVLKHLSERINQNFEKLPYTTQGMLGSISKKIEGLLSNYINLLDLFERYGSLMESDVGTHLNKKIQEEEKELQEAESTKLQNIKNRRLTILKKRLERFDSAHEKYLICESQLETIEDAVRYIYEQSMTMKNPDEVGMQLDNLLVEVEDTSQMIQDIDDDLSAHYNLLDKEEDLLTKESKEEDKESEQPAQRRVRE